MPARPWVERHPIDPNQHYVALASRLRLKSYRFIPSFLRDALQIRRQLAGTPTRRLRVQCRVGPQVVLNVLGMGGPGSLDAFIGTNPHHGITKGLQPRMAKSQFESLSISGDYLPMSWPPMKAIVTT